MAIPTHIDLRVSQAVERKEETKNTQPGAALKTNAWRSNLTPELGEN
jgi:hypothetical protein